MMAMPFSNELVLTDETPSIEGKEKWVKELAKEIEETIWKYIRKYGNASLGEHFEWECRIWWNEWNDENDEEE